MGAVIATSAVSEAVFRAFRRTIEATAGRASLHISNGSGGVPETLLEEVRAVPGIAGAAALVEGFVGLPGADGETVAIYGLDLLADEEHEAQIPRTAVHVPDEVLFVSRPDSVAFVPSFAQRCGLADDARLDVMAPSGRRTLVVRGSVDAEGPASLFGGAVGLMDLPAAQRLLAKEGRVDRVDVRLGAGADRDAVALALERLTRGRGRVESTAAAGARAEDVLFSIHVALSLAGLIAVVVGFFLIFHTVAVSVVQRRTEITLLAALGHSAGTLLAWLALEAVVLGTAALALGTGVGVLLARVSVATFGGVASAWLTLPAEPATLTAAGMMLGVTISLATPLVATLAVAWSFVTRPPAEQLRLTPASGSPGRQARRTLVVAGVGLGVTAVLLALAPQTLPYGPLLLFIFAVNSLALVSVALLAPLGAIGIGGVGRAISRRFSGIGFTLASRSLLRRPSAATAVVAAIVTGMGWTLSFLSLVGSLEHAWLGWLDEHFQSDLVVSAGTAAVSLLTYPPVEEVVAEELKTFPRERGVIE